MTYTECIEFNRWLDSAQPNEKYTYYIGMHLSDSFLSVELRQITWRAACQGLIYLVQQKLKSHTFRYVAIKASRPPVNYLLPFDAPEKARDMYKSLHNPKPKIKIIEEVEGHG